MNTLRSIIVWVTFALLVLPFSGFADDIDIYSGAGETAGIPNVLLVLDNAANFSSSAGTCTYVDGNGAPSLNGTAGGIEQCAIYNVIYGLQPNADGTAKVNIGIMMYNANGFNTYGCASGGNGGCLMKPLTPMTSASKSSLLSWIRTWTTSGNGSSNIKASGEATSATMEEAFDYYAGLKGPSGTTYTGVAHGCQKNFVIFIGNAFNSAGTPSDGGSTTPGSDLSDPNKAPGIQSSQLTHIIIPSGNYGTSSFSCGSYSMGNHNVDTGGLFADEWSRYMYAHDLYSDKDGNQGITTYTIGLLGASCKPDYPALLTSMAKYGGGKYYATSSYNEIAQALLDILNEVQAVNSIFASASLPVSVNTQGTYLNQIYMGMFRPDADGSPRWNGNLKQYQFIKDASGGLALGDSIGQPAISSAGTGFISPSAISYWTSKNLNAAPDNTGGFWVNDPNGAGLAYDLPDGEVVEKGGVSQQIRLANLKDDYAASPTSPRNVYTYCPSGSNCSSNLTDTSNQFATTNSAITAAMLSSSSYVNVSSITRPTSSPDNTATVTTSTSHGYVTGNTVTISGANQSEYNGSFAITVTSPTTFTYTVPVNPPTPATGTGYAASIPSNPLSVTGFSRGAGTPYFTATATVPGNNYTVGQNITISGAGSSEYNNTFTVTAVSGNNVSFLVAKESPNYVGGGGTAAIGTGNYTIAASPTGIVRGAAAVGGAGTRVLVNVTSNLANSVAVGNTVTISGASPTGYNGAFKIVGLGTSCSVINTTAAGGTTTTTGTNKKTICFDLASSAVTPATTGGSTSSTTADSGAAPVSITQLTRSGTTVTAVTSVPHPFSTGQTVSIGGTPGAGEGAYVGNYKVTSVPSSTSFTYTVTTTPSTPATGTIKAITTGGLDRNDLINWIRGEDNLGDEASPGSPYTVRPSVHGDVLHSRPIALNYGTNKVVVFYGDNGGVFHAINGNQTGNINGVPPGGELWGLVLPEFFTQLNRQREASPLLKLPSTPGGITPTPQTKDYFVDGPLGVYQTLDSNGNTTTAYIYLSMRRGGRFIYALDVSDPANPKVVWKISNATAGFSELGQTWSRPKLVLVKGYSNPVIFFGGGYDTAEDSEPPVADTMGRGIFAVDAKTGALVWSATSTTVSGMNYSIPAEVASIDRDSDGYTDRIYAVDVGGNIWRVDLEPTAGNAPSNWKVTKLAALGCDIGVCSSGVPRKFFFPPTVVSVGVAGSANAYDAVAIGSGDREHPLYGTGSNSAYNVTNRFFMVKDVNTGKDAGSPTAIVQSNLFNATNTNYDGSVQGFYITFDTGEKEVNAPLTQYGYIYFGTNQPAVPNSASCSANLGVAKGYAVSPFTGAHNSTVFDGGGLPPSPVSGVVSLANGEKKAFCIGCVMPPSDASGTPPSGGPCSAAIGNCNNTPAGTTSLRRTYWYKK